MAMMKRIADNPNNLFSLSMARLKRRHNQWRELIKPVLGVLLVAREPLSLRHIRQIIEVDDDSLFYSKFSFVDVLPFDFELWALKHVRTRLSFGYELLLC